MKYPQERELSVRNFREVGHFVRKCIFLLLLGLALPGWVWSQDLETAVFPDAPRLADYLAWADDHHPAIAGQVGQEAALRHAAQEAGALPDLKFGWGEMIVPVETRVGPQQRVFSLSQKLPWFGTLGLKESVATVRADAAAHRIQGRRLAVRYEVRDAWLQLAYLQGEIGIVARNLDLARQTEAAARSTYEAGTGSFAHVLSSQIEVDELSSGLAGLRDRIRPVTVRLNLAAGLASRHPTPTIPRDFLDTADPDLPSGEVLWSLLERNNPQLAALALEKESRSQAVDLAGKAAYPGLTLGVDYIMTGPAAMEGVPDSGKDPVIARLGVSIPLWGGKASAEKKASVGRLASASADLTDARHQLNSRFESALFAWREARRHNDLYGTTLVDSGRQALEVTSARYRSGQASYVDLVTSRKALLGLELAHLRAEVEEEQALNDLATLVGMDLEEWRHHDQ